MKGICIVTGASSGMGARFARAMMNRQGVDEIWLFARRADKIGALADSLNRPGAAIVVRPIAADLGGREGGRLIAGLLEEAGGRGAVFVHTLVNNAGFGTYGDFARTDINRQLDEIDLNVTALTAITGACMPYLERGSRVINTASLAAFSPMGGFAVYAASKAYVLNFSLGLAAELEGQGIDVIALCPGPVDTEFSRVASEGIREKVLHGANPDAVVRHCLTAAEKHHKKIAIMTFKWRLKAFLPRFFGRYFLAKLTMRTEKRPSKNG